MADTDLLIRTRDAERVRELIQELGYQHDGTAADVANMERGRYELIPFYKVRTLELEPGLSQLVRRHELSSREKKRYGSTRGADAPVDWAFEVDFHHNILRGRAPRVPELWRGPTPAALDGFEVRALRPTIQLWLLCVRCYLEMAWGDRRAARMLGDATVLITRDEINHRDLARLCAETRTGRLVYFVLRFLREFAAADVPEDAMRTLAEQALKPIDAPLIRQSNRNASEQRQSHGWTDVVPFLFARQAHPAAPDLTLYDAVPDANDSRPLTQDRQVGPVTQGEPARRGRAILKFRR